MGWEIFTKNKKTVPGVGTIDVGVSGDALDGFHKAVQQISDTVRSSRDGLVSILRSAAPSKTGALRRGIVASPAAEATAAPGKIVYDIYMDEKMNDTFVKRNRTGKRYYYPSSQEYGFRLKNGGYKPGLYYMRDTAIRYASAHEENVKAGMDQVLEEI